MNSSDGATPPITDRDRRHGGVAADHSRQLPRLRRIEGRIRGLQQMIEGGRDCVDITHQINAAVAALRRVQTDMDCAPGFGWGTVELRQPCGC